MTGLLVSVRDADEARAALAGGVDLLDIKEPGRGALGAADPTTIAAIVESVGGRLPVSCALGELVDSPTIPALPLRGIQFAKVGLAGMVRYDDWQRVWQATIEELPDHVAPVAVAYADWRRADAPHPMEIVRAGHQLNCRFVLFDTYYKDGGALPTLVAVDELNGWVTTARQQGMEVVLAGSLTAADLPHLAALAPTWFAVRGAACNGSRLQQVAEDRVRMLAECIAKLDWPSSAAR